MTKAIIVLLVVAVVGVGVYYLFYRGSTPGSLYGSPTPTPIVSKTPTPRPVSPSPVVSPTPMSVTVDIRGFAFNPSVLNIKAGTTVTWVNNDSVAHTLTTDSGIALHPLVLSPGQSFSMTFTSAGTTTYHCSIHTSMTGSVVVTN